MQYSAFEMNSALPSDNAPYSAYSRFAQRLRRRYPDQLTLLPQGVTLDRDTLAMCYSALRAESADVGTALRVLRQVVMERLICLDCDQNAPLDTITLAVTALAEFTLDIACTEAQATLDDLYGAPLGPEGQRADIWVVGMGKLGARELNVSSDIDLIYVYDHEGDTAGNAAGRNVISNHEYFGKVVKAIYGLIGGTTEHGVVCRVDLALRPNGNSGPAAIALNALE